MRPPPIDSSTTPPRAEPEGSPDCDQIEIDLDDAQIALAHRTDAELLESARLFRLLSSPWLSRVARAVGEFAVRYRLPFAERLAHATIYRQFVGGRTLLEVERASARLSGRDVLSILDYGAEGKDDEAAYNQTMTECIRAIEFAGRQHSIPMVSTKLSGLASNDLLEAVSGGGLLTAEHESGYRALARRVDSLCHVAREAGVQLAIDAEESWMQPAIDKVVMTVTLRYNRGRAVILNTYQLYRHDRIALLKANHAQCRTRSVVLGAKLVRGAYMAKERQRARAEGRPSPIQPDKAATDRDFDQAVAYCLDNLRDICFVNASHNQRSVQLMVEGIARRGIPRNHGHMMFCQLYGMGDNLTFNLAEAGYRVAKYLPYGPVREVVPYLVRRAEENASVLGESSRELAMIERELTRRGL